MKTKHAPTTSLPWRGRQHPDDHEAMFHQVNGEQGDCVAAYMPKKDADYVVHACNAYPRLVKVLQTFADIHSHEDTREALHAAMKACDLLLEELGEL